jgi:hypothetical protein
MKKIQVFGFVLLMVSFFWVLGSVGACECDNITLGQCAVQSLFGIAGAWLGCKMLDLGEAVK